MCKTSFCDVVKAENHIARCRPRAQGMRPVPQGPRALRARGLVDQAAIFFETILPSPCVLTGVLSYVQGSKLSNYVFLYCPERGYEAWLHFAQAPHNEKTKQTVPRKWLCRNPNIRIIGNQAVLVQSKERFA